MKITKLKIKNFKNGYAVLELFFYISFFAVFCLLVINAIVTMTRSFRETAIQAEWTQSANIMERISREIRKANSIDPVRTSSDLKLNTTTAGGAVKTIEFKFISPNIELWDEGANIG